LNPGNPRNPCGFLFSQSFAITHVMAHKLAPFGTAASFPPRMAQRVYTSENEATARITMAIRYRFFASELVRG
jgi:hypothetical protein